MKAIVSLHRVSSYARSGLIIFLLFLLTDSTRAQLPDDMNIFARAQLRASMLYPVDSNIDQSSYSAQIRRFRFGLKGDLIDKKFDYFIQLAYDDTEFPLRAANRFELLDASATWKMNEQLSLKFGQFLMSGNLERMMNPLNQQFVEHSIVSSQFSLERDIGIELKHQWKIGSIAAREFLFIGNGDGPGSLGDYGGFQYLGRLEILPFGFFEKEGEMFLSDLTREDRMKLLLGASASFNDNTRYGFVDLNDDIVEAFERDVLYWNVDMLSKWKGWSFYAQLTNRSVNVPVIYGKDLDFSGYYRSGQSYSAQLGYVLVGNYEIAGRYTGVINSPDHLLLPSSDLDEYTIVVSKFVNDHKVKAQLDVSYQAMKNIFYEDQLIARAQLSIGF